ncbi:DUF4232 domain-containing protein [Amycolatopsis sp. NPDC049252]|uniref:DUF4232 domain-containing protein n=1 Tax=Amycolatopsis sp. NPDC049252 TaxID=3363933 RepID=UPI00371E2E60
MVPRLREGGGLRGTPPAGPGTRRKCSGASEEGLKVPNPYTLSPPFRRGRAPPSRARTGRRTRRTPARARIRHPPGGLDHRTTAGAGRLRLGRRHRHADSAPDRGHHPARDPGTGRAVHDRHPENRAGANRRRRYTPIVVTDTGGPCRITGNPGVSFYAGSDHHQVGEAATRDTGGGAAAGSVRFGVDRPAEPRPLRPTRAPR